MVPEAVAVLAYVGPPPLTAARMLTSWRLNPGVLATSVDAAETTDVAAATEPERPRL
jgi:hypothetical protein